jgi:hypothetical protein
MGFIMGEGMWCHGWCGLSLASHVGGLALIPCGVRGGQSGAG